MATGSLDAGGLAEQASVAITAGRWRVRALGQEGESSEGACIDGQDLIVDGGLVTAIR